MSRRISPRNLCLYVRAAVLGTVKTRLAKTLGPTGALAAHERLVAHAIGQLSTPADIERWLWVAGDEEHDSIAQWAGQWEAQTLVQQGDDLAARLWHTFCHHATADCAAEGATLIVGADCPPLDAALVDTAFKALAKTDVVLAPAEDGGYGLIGLNHEAVRRSQTPLSGLVLGTAEALTATVGALTAAGLEVALIDGIWDVDRLPDWERFQRSYADAVGPAGSAVEVTREPAPDRVRAIAPGVPAADDP